jgi:hypothetical protein
LLHIPVFTPSSTGNNSNASTAAPTVGSGLFSLPSKSASSPAPANPSSSGTLGNIFGGGGFGQSSATLPASSLGGNKETPTAPTNLAGQFSDFSNLSPLMIAATGTGLFGGVSGNKDAEKKESAPPGTLFELCPTV